MSADVGALPTFCTGHAASIADWPLWSRSPPSSAKCRLWWELARYDWLHRWARPVGTNGGAGFGRQPSSSSRGRAAQPPRRPLAGCTSDSTRRATRARFFGPPFATMAVRCSFQRADNAASFRHRRPPTARPSSKPTGGKLLGTRVTPRTVGPRRGRFAAQFRSRGLVRGAVVLLISIAHSCWSGNCKQQVDLGTGRGPVETTGPSRRAPRQ